MPRLHLLLVAPLLLGLFASASGRSAPVAEIDERTEDVRATPPDLNGTFWVVSREDGERIEHGKGFVSLGLDLTFLTALVTQVPTGDYRLQLQGSFGESLIPDEDEPVLFRVLRTADPDMFLALENAGDEDGLGLDPQLLVRSRSGTWVFYPWHGNLNSLIYGGRALYLTEVAKRHGVQINSTYSAELEFDATVEDAALSALFSDPSFLGGLRFGTERSGRLFPANLATSPQKPEWPEESEDTEQEHGNLNVITVVHSPIFSISPDELSAPAGFAGRYVQAGMKVEISRQKDGSYRVSYPTIDWAHHEKLKLLSLDQDSESGPDNSSRTYLGLSEYFDTLQEKALYKWYVVTIGCEGGVFVTSISHTGADDTNPEFSTKIEKMTTRLRKQAAQRHSLTIFDNHVAGDLSAENARALFADPQFQVGLEEFGYDAHYKALDSINRCEDRA